MIYKQLVFRGARVFCNDDIVGKRPPIATSRVFPTELGISACGKGAKR